MKQDNWNHGVSDAARTGPGQQREQRPAPGKVTRTSKLPGNSKVAVHDQAVTRDAAAAASKPKAPSDFTTDLWMDAAHRGLSALSESSPAAVQARGNVKTDEPAAVHEAAARGVSGTGSVLPHLDRIQTAFGGHDLSNVRAHIGGNAAAASEQTGAEAYAMGNRIAFRSQPDLHTAAHEAAHVVQQRAGVQLDGGVGRAGDVYERNADAVADAVVRGESAASLLSVPWDQSAMAAVQGAVQRQDVGTRFNHFAHSASPPLDPGYSQSKLYAIANFMAVEMGRNAQGSQVNDIHEKLDFDKGDLIPLWEYPKEKAEAYLKWYNLVKDKGKWDHKGFILGKWGRWSKDKKNGLEYSFDIWSNVHYGYVGKACGFPEGILLDFAGAAQDLAATLRTILRKIPFNIGGIRDAILSLIRKLLGITGAGELAALDDPDDQVAIKLGFELLEQIQDRYNRERAYRWYS